MTEYIRHFQDILEERFQNVINILIGLQSYLYRLLWLFYWALFLWPTRMVFMYGPGMLTFWEGKSQEEICAHLTGTRVQHWNGTSNLNECRDLLERKINSYIVLVMYLLYLVILCSCAHRLITALRIPF